jgi:hypothetical protein
MKAYLDTTTWMLTAVAGGMQPLRKMDAKRVLVLDVVLSAALPTGSNGILCLKRDKNFTGAAMALDTAWEAVSGEALTYRFTLSLNTEEIAALFTGEKETASLHADITITRPDLDTVGSQTFDVVVWRPVYQGDEQTPTPATTLVPVVQFIDDVPSAKDDFFMFEGGVAPSSGMYQTSDAQYNYTFKGGWTYWRRAAIAMWMLLAAGLLAGAAQYDMVYIQKDSAGDTQERVVTLTPSTFLSVSNNGTLQVQSAADFRAAIGLATVATSGNFSDLTGKPTTLAGYGIGGVWQTLTHGVSETTPSINNVIPSMPAALVTVDCYSSFPYNATSAAVALPSYPLVPGQIIRITAGTLASYPSALPIKIYGRNPGPDTWTNLKATLTATGQSVTLVARDAYSWTVLPPDTHATSHATGGADALTPAQIGAATAAQGSLAATALQPGWTGSGNLTTIGTLASGTVPVARISGLGSLATQNGTFSGTSSGNNTGDQDLSGYAAKAGNETISGNWNFTGNLTMNLADSVTFQRVNIGSEDYGWRYNPAGGGQVEFVFPGGAAAFYQTGHPLHVFSRHRAGGLFGGSYRRAHNQCGWAHGDGPHRRYGQFSHRDAFGLPWCSELRRGKWHTIC